MQNKKTSAPAAEKDPNPLAGVDRMEVVAAFARQALPRSTSLDGALFSDSICHLTGELFAGRLWHYQPIALRYHDFAHTLQASHVYLALALAAQRDSASAPSDRQLELGLAAVLLHDTGYLKARGDDLGSGAKYTHCHVLRSCALAASLLPTVGCTTQEIDDVLGAIRCTGLSGTPAQTLFTQPGARRVACLVATADYVGQMAAPDYPEKLPALFAEFQEADDFCRVPPERRMFASADELLAATGGFWSRFVLPKLAGDFEGVYRLLGPGGDDSGNPYLRAIEHNIAAVTARAPA